MNFPQDVIKAADSIRPYIRKGPSVRIGNACPTDLPVRTVVGRR